MHTRQLLIKFGKRVREVRQDKHLSQEKLAELAGFDRTYISLVERGLRNISLINLVRLAAALRVSPSALVRGLVWH
ncbi:MAG: helix-turn-helix domain-containing protein [Acidobacteriia bacterium]|nr:helix-turn-helix domain-containing protein [Terriglobia bacterium]